MDATFLSAQDVSWRRNIYRNLTEILRAVDYNTVEPVFNEPLKFNRPSVTKMAYAMPCDKVRLL